MKKVFVLLLSLVYIPITGLCQVDNKSNFIYLFSDSVIYGKSLEYKTSSWVANYFILDSKKVPDTLVKFYKIDTAFYANKKMLNVWSSSSFVKRIRKGKINLFEEEITYFNSGGINSSGFITGGGSRTEIYNYYNIDFNDLKKAKYKYLVKDLQGNIESMAHLEKFKFVRNTEAILFLSGIPTFFIGLVTLVNKTSNIPKNENQNPNVTVNLVTMFTGAGFLLTAPLISFLKPKHIRRAIDTYNK